MAATPASESAAALAAALAAATLAATAEPPGRWLAARSSVGSSMRSSSDCDRLSRITQSIAAKACATSLRGRLVMFRMRAAPSVPPWRACTHS